MWSFAWLAPSVGALVASLVPSLPGTFAQITGPSTRPQAFKLNGSLAQPSSADVLDFVLDPAGTRVVYRADPTRDSQYELFSTPLDGSTPSVRLNDPLALGSNVGGSVINVFGTGETDYLVAAGSGRVVYVADSINDGFDDLFSIPGDRSTGPVQLSAGIPFGDVQDFWLSEDGQVVVFLAGEFGQSALFHVPTDGSAPAAAFTGYTSKFEVWLSHDGKTVVYSEVTDFGTRMSLYQVPVDGSAAPSFLVQSAPPILIGYVMLTGLSFSDDDTRIVFEQIFDEDDLVRSDLLTAALDGSSAPRYLNQQPLDDYVRVHVYDGGERVAFLAYLEGGLVASTLDGSQRTVIAVPEWTPLEPLMLSGDRTRLVFRASRGAQRGLFQVPLDASAAPVQLVVGAATLQLLHVVGSTAVYSSGSALFSIPLAGGTALRLNPAPYDNAVAEPQIHPGGQHVLFRADPNGSGVSHLYRAPLDASALPQRLSDAMGSAADVTRHATAGAGDFIVYMADAHHNETFELLGAPFTGGPDLTYNVPLAIGPVLGDVQTFWVSADEERVVYRADQDLDGTLGLYANRSDGQSAPISLLTGLPENHGVMNALALSPDGTRAAYMLRTGPLSAGGILYVADTTQVSAPRLLDSRIGLHEGPLLISSLGTRVVYRRSSTLFGPFELCSARLTGTPALRTLTAPTGDVLDFQLSADGLTAYFNADLDAADVFELYRVPIEGGAAPMKLSPPLSGELDVVSFAEAPGGAHVIYLGDQEVAQQFELYSVASDGSAPAVRLNPALIAAGDVSDFLVTAGGTHVVYRADQIVDQRFELFRVPIGGGTPVLLTPVAAGTGVQGGYVASSDGQTLYYLATHSGASVVELFRVAADGSSAPVRLSGALVAGGNVSAFALAPDQQHLAYLADQRTDGVFELFGATPVPGTDVLLHALPATGDVSSFRIAPDSASVVYRADALDSVFELFAVPPDGSAPPRRLSPTPTHDGDVETDFVALSGGRALYRADHEEDNVVELWSALHGPRLRAGKLR